MHRFQELRDSTMVNSEDIVNKLENHKVRR